MLDDRVIFIQDTSGEGVDQWKMLCPELRALSGINGDHSKGFAVLDRQTNSSLELVLSCMTLD
jgi:hypothetical protein